jgi:hypothetical protein
LFKDLGIFLTALFHTLFYLPDKKETV